jgi:hypothetical protein
MQIQVDISKVLSEMIGIRMYAGVVPAMVAAPGDRADGRIWWSLVLKVANPSYNERAGVITNILAKWHSKAMRTSVDFIASGSIGLGKSAEEALRDEGSNCLPVVVRPGELYMKVFLISKDKKPFEDWKTWDDPTAMVRITLNSGNRSVTIVKF